MQPHAPAILTIFGITGDLAQRKLLPALYYLALGKLLPETFKIVGISRRGTKVEDVLAHIKKIVEASGESCDQSTLDWLENALSIVDMDITNDSSYVDLKHKLDSLEAEAGVCFHRLFYLAIPSSLFTDVVRRLGRALSLIHI